MISKTGFYLKSTALRFFLSMTSVFAIALQELNVGAKRMCFITVSKY